MQRTVFKCSRKLGADYVALCGRTTIECDDEDVNCHRVCNKGKGLLGASDEIRASQRRCCAHNGNDSWPAAAVRSRRQIV